MNTKELVGSLAEVASKAKSSKISAYFCVNGTTTSREGM